jgi:metal-responsive CopG/Arc/MetJ family transcriptional regulator
MSKSKSEERVRLQVFLSEAMLVAIDDYRYSTRAPSRAEAIRRLLRKGRTAK